MLTPKSSVQELCQFYIALRSVLDKFGFTHCSTKKLSIGDNGSVDIELVFSTTDPRYFRPIDDPRCYHPAEQQMFAMNFKLNKDGAVVLYDINEAGCVPPIGYYGSAQINESVMNYRRYLKNEVYKELSARLTPFVRELTTDSEIMGAYRQGEPDPTPKRKQAPKARPIVDTAPGHPDVTIRKINHEGEVLIRKLDPRAIIPSYKHEGDAGFDFCCLEDYQIKTGELVMVRTGLAVSFSSDYELQIRPRSSLVIDSPLIIPNSPCTIDSNYRGEIKIPVRNISPEFGDPIKLLKGQRIAQGILSPISTAIFKEVKELPESDRGENGFGSTGKM